ncbi:Sporulation related domain-containing protein [Sphingomonas gellani]|uniref:Sporulation related domain-containing protein n=1 Tax=Sphingomonas gellani TaxID=1166340 RepID=A0A1H8FN16_9SPHN|nr:SPOR domain-containing protein [Sphingomonas gellani]SEN33211.1 Sporulation related domain-containing protein [Sphingomonas gellani]
MADHIDLRDEDRLPWLETVEPDQPHGPPMGRVIAFVLLGLVVLAGIVYAVYALQRGQATPDGQLIAAQEGDYKVRPTDTGGMKVKGEGDAAIATSAGKNGGTGAIDLNAVPEVPVEGKRAVSAPAKPEATAGSTAVAKVPSRAGKLVAAVPVGETRGNAAAPTASGSLVQLGAYPTEAAANAAWTSYSKRFAYLAPLGKSVQPVATGGRTLFRLRVNAGSTNQASELCGRLRVAGESCFVAS